MKRDASVRLTTPTTHTARMVAALSSSWGAYDVPLSALATLVCVVLGAASAASAQQGRVYALDAVSTPVPIDAALPDLAVSDPLHLNGLSGQLRVVNYVSGSVAAGDLVVEQALEPNAGSDFLYDPPINEGDGSDGFAQVNVYYHVARGLDFSRAILGVDMNGGTWPLVAVANAKSAGSPLDDVRYSSAGLGGAFSAPNVILVGQGAERDFAVDSDPILRAVHLYVSHRAIGFSRGPLASDSYGLSPFGEAIDQGLADYFAATQNDDPEIGQASLALLGEGRDLSDAAGRCPDDLGGIASEDGRIVGAMAWSVRQSLGASLADALLWGAERELAPSPTLRAFADALLAVADDAVEQGSLTTDQRAQVADAVDAAGLSSCDRELTLSPDAPSALRVAGLDAFALLAGTTCATLQAQGAVPVLFHHRVGTAVGDSGLRVVVDVQPEAVGSARLRVFARVGAHVTFRPGDTLPELDRSDYQSAEVSADHFELTIDAASTPAFVPGAEYFFAIAYAGCSPATLAVGAEQLDGSGSGTPTGRLDDGGIADAQVDEPGSPGSGSADASSADGGSDDALRTDAGAVSGHSGEATDDARDARDASAGCGCRIDGVHGVHAVNGVHGAHDQRTGHGQWPLASIAIVFAVGWLRRRHRRRRRSERVVLRSPVSLQSP